MVSVKAKLLKDFEFSHGIESKARVSLPKDTEVVLIDNSETHYNLVYQDFSTTIEKTEDKKTFKIIK